MEVSIIYEKNFKEKYIFLFKMKKNTENKVTFLNFY